jgi:hypothetical protein
MEKSIKGTKTEENLLKAFAGESQAKNRYEFSTCPACLHSDSYAELKAENY